MIDRPVKKIGGSWVITLDRDTRSMLGIKKLGDLVTVVKKEQRDYDDIEPYRD